MTDRLNLLQLDGIKKAKGARVSIPKPNADSMIDEILEHRRREEALKEVFAPFIEAHEQSHWHIPED